MKTQQEIENFFTPLANNRPYLKVAAEGFAGSGKTYTCVNFAIGLHKDIKSTKPIVCFDTERALKALKPLFDKSGIQVLVRESRSLADLVKTIDYCESGVADILLIDSITHVWEAYLENYKAEKKRSFIQFQDWGVLKPLWKRQFSDKLVMSKLHILFTGRAGYEYDNELNEATGKKELMKSGIKMKVEGETEYEPDIVFLMERQKEFKDGKQVITRSCSILKDRTTMIDGMEFINPSYKDFKPAVKVLLNGTSKDLDVTPEAKDEFATMEDNYDKSRKQRDIALEEIQGILTQLFPGQTSKEKKLKVDILERVFLTRSWKAIEIMPIGGLMNGVATLEKFKTDVSKLLKDASVEGVEPETETILALLDEVEPDGAGNDLELLYGDIKQ
ncbi:MAG: AAA family ATPase [Ignavibacteriales bacterium]|nr:AAA family ATPase [Ignavibacteriales bacterium]